MITGLAVVFLVNLQMNITKKHWTFTRCGSMLVHRLQRWPNIEPKLGKRLVLSGNFVPS